jgi:hypothetical protein
VITAPREVAAQLLEIADSLVRPPFRTRLTPAIYGVRFYTGRDLACLAGTAIVIVTGGRAHVMLGSGGGFGNNVQVQVGNLWVRYAHLEALLAAAATRWRRAPCSGWRARPASRPGRTCTSRWTAGVRRWAARSIRQV